MKLIIVESPNKREKIQHYAGPGFEVAATVGHFRELAVDKATGSIGVDRARNHEPIFVITERKQDVVATLRRKAKEAGPEGVYVATDPDREGEGIAWHVCQVLGLNLRTTKRIKFQEITEKAVQAALATPGTVDLKLVSAQQCRQVLDRLVGFELSPFLSRKIAPGLSAGRVQSVAVRLLVEREREILQFLDRYSVPVTALVQTSHGEQIRARRTAPAFGELALAKSYLHQLGQQPQFVVVDSTCQPAKREPAPAFSTSTLQQEGVKKLKFKVKHITELAQKLFEGGHVTYIRTDSVNLSQEAIDQAQAQISAQFGAGQFEARKWKNKENAQEAHEAIRPTHWESTTAGSTPDEQALYRLIYTRALASQMVAAHYDQTTLTLAPVSEEQDTYTSSTRVLVRPGFLAAYQEAEEESEDPEEAEATLKHPLTQGELLSLVKLEAKQSYARPPKRYTEATLVQTLEKHGIGRPSTYSSIIQTIFDRGYVETGNAAGKKVVSQGLTWEKGQLTPTQKTETLGADKEKMLPTLSGQTVTDCLLANFPRIMSYEFTASCEEIFDEIAQGKKTYQEFVPVFDKNLASWLAKAGGATPDRADLQKRVVGSFEGLEIVQGTGKNGPYLLHNEQYYNIPTGVEAATLNQAQAELLITHRRATAPRELGQHQGKPVVVGKGKNGLYVRWNEQYYHAPAEHTDRDSVSLAQALGFIEQAAADVLATVGKYTIGRNQWGLYVSDGQCKAKFRPEVSEEQAKGTTAAECAAMIKSYQEWLKKKDGKSGKSSKPAKKAKK